MLMLVIGAASAAADSNAITHVNAAAAATPRINGF
jgi:hypothetical protein